MLRIRRVANGQVVYILSGRMDAEQATGLDKLFRDEQEEKQIVLDLKDLTLVNRDAVQFLERCEMDGMTIRNCPAYIRVWIDRERNYAGIRGEHRSMPDAMRDD